jgi:micrococcal nuclease
LPQRHRLSGEGASLWPKAKQVASALAFGKNVTLQIHSYDKYKRTLADVLLPDGTNLPNSLPTATIGWFYSRWGIPSRIFPIY